MTLDNAFFALSDPTRRAILQRLTVGEATVTDLAAPFDMSQPAISRHLRVLEEAGLLTRRIDGSKRPCQIREEGLGQLHEWLEDMHEALSQNYDRLDAVLARNPNSKKEKK